jgi:protein-tyrosine-phosphatase
MLLSAELNRRGIEGITIESAGTNATSGQMATEGARRALAKRNLDLRPHRSRDLVEVGTNGFDRFLCMTSGHAAFVRSLGVPPQKIEVVNAEHGGVPDPFGGTDEDYESTAQVLEAFSAEATPRLTAR